MIATKEIDNLKDIEVLRTELLTSFRICLNLNKFWLFSRRLKLNLNTNSAINTRLLRRNVRNIDCSVTYTTYDRVTVKANKSMVARRNSDSEV